MRASMTRAYRLVVAGILLARLSGAQQRELREAARLDAEQKCEEAESHYRKALAQGSPSIALLNNFGNHFLACGQPDRAQPWFERVARLDPAHANACLQLARIETGQKHGARALAYLARVKDNDPSVRLLRAEATHWAGQHQAAARQLAAIEPETAANPRLLFEYSLACARIGLFDRAENAFNALAGQYPGDFDLLFNLGRAAARAGHRDRATRALEAALKARPGDPGTLFEMGLLAAAGEDFPRAVYWLAQANRAAPARPDILLALARAAEGAGYDGDAALAYDEYLKLQPGDDAARRDRGLVYGLSGRVAEGVAELNRYVRRHPEDPAGHYDLARLAWSTDPRRALDSLSTALRVKPDFAPARLARGWLLYREGRLQEALPDLEAADRAAPGNVRILAQLGLVLLSLDRPARAEAVLRRAQSIEPGDPDVLLHLGRSLIASGKEEEGRGLLEKFQKLRPASVRGPRREAGMIELAALPPLERTRRQLERLREDARSHPGDAELQLSLAALLLADGQAAEARDEFRVLLASSADARIRRRAGALLLAAEQYDLARTFLEAAGDDPGPRLGLAISVFFSGEPEPALAALASVPGCDQTGDCLLWKARILEALGRAEEAGRALDRGLRLPASDPRVARRTALWLLRHHRLADASALLRRSMAAPPGDPDLLLLRAIVSSLEGQTAAAEQEIREVESKWPEWDRAWLAHGLLIEHARPAEARRKLQTAVALGAPDLAARCALARLAAAPAPEQDCACADTLEHWLLATCEALSTGGAKEQAVAGPMRYALNKPRNSGR